MKRFTEGVYAHFHRPPKEPLRLLSEMAEEFGVTHGQLRSFIQRHQGPEPEFTGKSNKSSQKNYYRPSAMRKWWKDVSAK